MDSDTRDGTAGQLEGVRDRGAAGGIAEGVSNNNGHATRIFGKKESELAVQAGTGLIWLSALVSAAILLPNFLVDVPVSPTRVKTVVNWGALWSAGFYGILLAGLGWTVRIGGRVLDRTGI